MLTPSDACELLKIVLSPHEPYLTALRERGAKPYLVGGAVRDALLGHTPSDLDIEVHGITPEKLEKILQRLGSVTFAGKSFGVYHTPHIEFSLPREDQKIGPGHQGFHAHIDPALSFQQAARRRDLTMNAMGYDIVHHCLVDPYGGIADMQQNRLRAVCSTSFSEDPLRGLRVAQFAARFIMEPDAELITLCKALNIKELPSARVAKELHKLFQMGQKPSLGVAFLHATGLDAALPFLNHFPLDQWGTALSTLDVLASQTGPGTPVHGYRELLILATLTHFAPMTVTQDHLRQTGFPSRLTAQITPLLKAANQLAHVITASCPDRPDVCWLWHGIQQASLPLEVLCILATTVQGITACADRFHTLCHHLNITPSDITPIVQGRDLIRYGVSPGAHFGALLWACQDVQYTSSSKDPTDIIKKALSLQGPALALDKTSH